MTSENQHYALREPEKNSLRTDGVTFEKNELATILVCQPRLFNNRVLRLISALLANNINFEFSLVCKQLRKGNG